MAVGIVVLCMYTTLLRNLIADIAAFQARQLLHDDYGKIPMSP